MYRDDRGSLPALAAIDRLRFKCEWCEFQLLTNKLPQALTAAALLADHEAKAHSDEPRQPIILNALELVAALRRN